MSCAWRAHAEAVAQRQDRKMATAIGRAAIPITIGSSPAAQSVDGPRGHAPFMLDERLGKMAADLAGVEGIRIWHDQALIKEAWANPTAWHLDNPYWSFPSPTPSPVGGSRRCYAEQRLSLFYAGHAPRSDV